MEPGFDDEIARVAAAHHGIFALHHLRDLGARSGTPHERISTGRWESVHTSVYRMAGAPVTWRSELLAACWAGGIRAMASHRSAAALWDLPAGRTDVVELTCPRWRRARHEQLVVHESTVIEDVDRATVTNIPCTSPTRTLFDLARALSPVMLDANIDSALRRRLVTIESLLETVDRLATRGRPGGQRFRTAIAQRIGHGANPESVPERLLAHYLVLQGLPAPVMQYEVRTPCGELVGRADLAYPSARILIEYDSYQEHTGKLALVRDSARRNALIELGFNVLTATAVDLDDRARRLAISVRRLHAQAA